MEKIATGPEAADVIDIEKPIADNIKAVAKANALQVRDVTVVILDRPRHEQMVKEIRQVGARIKFISDGDVAGALMTAMPETGVNLLIGIGGAPEGVITACALKALGGNMQVRIWPRNDEERRIVEEENLDTSAVLTMDDLVKSDNTFFAATGITDGELLKGCPLYIAWRHDAVTGHSIQIRHGAISLMPRTGSRSFRSIRQLTLAKGALYWYTQAVRKAACILSDEFSGATKFRIPIADCHFYMCECF